MLAKLLDMRVIVSQQGIERSVIQFWMLPAPLADLHLELRPLIQQRLLLLLAGFELGSQLNQLTLSGLKRLSCRCLVLTGLLDSVFQRLLPLLGCGMLAQQVGQYLLTGVLLLAEPGDFKGQFGLALQAGLLFDLFLLDLLLAFALFLLLFALLLKLVQPLSHLLLELHDRSRSVVAQAFEHLRRNQWRECGQFFFQPLLIGIQLLELVGNVARGGLAGFGCSLELLLQAGRVFLQGQQGLLALLVAGDDVVQLAQLLAQPGVTLVCIAVQQLSGERMSLKVWCQCLVTLNQLIVLAQQFFLPGDHAANLFTQLIALLGQQVHSLLRAGLLAVVVPSEAFQQRFRLMPGVFDAAAHRAGLVILQLHAQFFDTGTARQTLTFQELPGDAQGLFGDGQFVANADAFAVELVALLLGALLLLRQISELTVDVLLAGPQAGQLFEGALLFAIVLQQAAENLHLLGHRFDFAIGFPVEQFQCVALLGQLLIGFAGALLQGRQFLLPVLEPVGDQGQ
ncbi:hypothetical protein ALQ65_05500 [Pseudomonas syringae pv. coriandricola]|uniref:Uncharacterized protein n=1 Tax=Pseudomonas syringae pv. coriandricola TaxID=264453 RepID=A0A3M3JDU6_9PSED|nr:hypothetical protein ALQ65_05500 [Pseudomonas syringae pv. coriandricola]